jgi:hypothetical protein
LANKAGAMECGAAGEFVSIEQNDIFFAKLG